MLCIESAEITDVSAAIYYCFYIYLTNIGEILTKFPQFYRILYILHKKREAMPPFFALQLKATIYL